MDNEQMPVWQRFVIVAVSAVAILLTVWLVVITAPKQWRSGSGRYEKVPSTVELQPASEEHLEWYRERRAQWAAEDEAARQLAKSAF